MSLVMMKRHICSQSNTSLNFISPFLARPSKAMRIRENDIPDSAPLPLGAPRCAVFDLPGMLEDEKDVGREGVVVDSRV
jgi:hypothetical protein